MPDAIPANIEIEQAELWGAAASVGAIVFGSPKWTQVAPSEFKIIDNFFRAVHDGIQPSSAGGVRIIPSERDAVLLLPLPSNITRTDAETFLTRMDQMAGGILPDADLDLLALAGAASNLVQVATELQSRGWQTTYDASIRGLAELTAEQDQALGSLAGDAGAQVRLASTAAQVQGGSLLVPGAFYKLVNVSDGFVQRGRMPDSGRFDQLFLAPNSFFTLHYVEPATGKTALTAFWTGASGTSLTIPRAIFVEPSSPDSDGDGLSDEAEEILGTNPAKFSTCGDGIGDLAKAQQGLDLQNCLPAPTGIIASLPLRGSAEEVVLVGSTANAQQQTAYVACGPGGICVVDASKFQMPIVLGHLDLPGDANDLAVDSDLKIAAVAANLGGLHLVDVSDSMQPKLIQTIRENANQVEVRDGVVYAAIGSAIISYDVLTGDRLQTLLLGTATLTGLAREGLVHYAMDSGLTLHAVDISGPVMVARGSLSTPDGGGQLFVGNGVAYVAAPSNPFGGFSTVNVSDPSRLTLMSGSSATLTAASPNPVVIANGSGLALVLSVGFAVSPRLQVFNVSDPANTGRVITQFGLPSPAFGLAIGAGIAFVADGANGLQVVTYLPFDNQGVAPVVSISTSSTDVVEGSLLPVQVQVSDDVQVRSVELLVNGQVVLNDVSFPFDLIAAMPLLSAGSSEVVIQARAIDTGGNIGLSNPINIQLISDTTPPVIINIAPANHSSPSVGLRAVRIVFSEPIDETTLTDQSVQLLGPNGAVSPENIQFRIRGAEVQFTYPVLSLGDYQIVLDGPAVKDRAGNALSTTNVVSAFKIQSFGTAVWINPNSGLWDDPGSWASGVPPGPNDDVIVAVPGNVTVTIRQGTNAIHSLLSSNAFTMTGGTLIAASTVEVNNTLSLSGGRIVGGTLSGGSGGAIIVTNVTAAGAMIFDGVTLSENLTVLAGTLTVTNGLTLSGAALTLASSSSRQADVLFLGTQTLGGSGEVLFAGTDLPLNPNHLYVDGNGTPAGAATLTIGPGISIHGTASGNVIERSGNNTIVNQGTISADTAGHTILFGVNSGYGKSAVNLGTLQAINEGNLTAQVLLNQGNISISDGSTLTLQQSWNNAGTIAATNATVNLGSYGSTFTLANVGTFNRSGGTVFITGTLDNTGTTLALDATTGSWTLGAWNKSGTIKGGTVTATGGAGLLMEPNGGGALNGVTLATDLALDSGTLDVQNGLTLSNATVRLANPIGQGCSYLLFEGTQTFGGTGTVRFESICGAVLRVLRVQGAGLPTLTIGPNIILQGTTTEFIQTDTASASLINQGTLLANGANNHIDIGLNTTNQGTIQALNGGYVFLRGALVNSGQLTPGNPPQVLTVDGSCAQLAPGVLYIHLGGTTPGTGFSQLQATGAVTLGGTLDLTLVNGFDPNPGDAFEIVTSPAITGQFTAINGLSLSGGKTFQPVYTATNLTLQVIQP
jgi:hypothetical protein